MWRDKEYTGGRWREGTKVGPGVLNRFIGLKPGHHYSRLAFCRPIVPGREDCTVSICPRRPVSRANHRASFSSIPSNSLRIALRSFASFHRVNRNGSTTTTIDPRCNVIPRKSTPPPRSGINLGEERVGWMLRQIFIVSDTPPDFSEPSDTDSRSPWLAEIIYWRGHKGEEETRLRY